LKWNGFVKSWGELRSPDYEHPQDAPTSFPIPLMTYYRTILYGGLEEMATAIFPTPYSRLSFFIIAL
jgi:hypothetical protein